MDTKKYNIVQVSLLTRRTLKLHLCKYTGLFSSLMGMLSLICFFLSLQMDVHFRDKESEIMIPKMDDYDDKEVETAGR